MSRLSGGWLERQFRVSSTTVRRRRLVGDSAQHCWFRYDANFWEPVLPLVCCSAAAVEGYQTLPPMTPPVETKQPPLNLVISLLATKTPDLSQFSRRNELSTPLPFELPPPLPDIDIDKQDFQTRVHGVLDVLSRAVLTDYKQVAAIAASVAPPRPGSDNIHTTLYVSLNPGIHLPTEDQMAGRIQDIVRDLKRLADSEMSNASQSLTMKPLPTQFMATFYSYGWKRFQYYYNKRAGRLPEARRLLEKFKVEHTGSSSFGPDDIEHLGSALRWLEIWGKVVQLTHEELRSTLAAVEIGEQYKRFKGLIDRGDRPPPSGLIIAYDTFEKYLKLKHNFIPIIRWITKLYSFHFDARRLVALATSIRFRSILFGDLEIKIYHQQRPWKLRIECKDDILLATIAHLRQKFELSHGQGKDEQKKSLTDDDIVQKFNGALTKEWSKYFNPSACVHCEVYLLRCIQIAHVSILPYIGVSKLSCVPCSVYFELQAAAGFPPVSTKGSHAKVYPGWSFPSGGMDAGDPERVSYLQTKVRDHLESLLWRYVDDMQRNPRKSDSSVGSDDSHIQYVIDHGENMSPEWQDIWSKMFPRAEIFPTED